MMAFVIVFLLVGLVGAWAGAGAGYACGYIDGRKRARADLHNVVSLLHRPPRSVA